MIENEKFDREVAITLYKNVSDFFIPEICIRVFEGDDNWEKGEKQINQKSDTEDIFYLFLTVEVVKSLDKKYLHSSRRSQELDCSVENTFSRS